MERSYIEDEQERECENDDSGCPSYLDAISAGTNLDPHILVALPVDIRLEVIEEERRRCKSEGEFINPTNNRQVGGERQYRTNESSHLEKDNTSYHITHCASDPLEDNNDPVQLEGNPTRNLLGIGMQVNHNINSNARDLSWREERLDPNALAELPPDVRLEVIQQEMRRLEQETSDKETHQTKSRSYGDSISSAETHWTPEIDDDGQVEVIKSLVEESGEIKYNRFIGPQIDHYPEGSSLDPSVLAALPPEIRSEVIEEERKRFKKENSQDKNNCIEVGQPKSSCGMVKQYDSCGTVDSNDSPMPEQHPVTHFTGEFKSSEKLEGMCEVEWKDGSLYKGMIRDGKRSGEGKLIYPNGTIYEGGWKNDVFHGGGKHVFPDGYRYNGNYYQGQPDGEGRCDFPNGDFYIGHWKNGKMCGYGVYSHVNGDVFKGMYKNDKRHGPGQYTFKWDQTDIIMYYDGYRIGEGVRWSHDRKRAWLLDKADIIGEVSVDVAKSMTLELVGDLGVITSC